MRIYSKDRIYFSILPIKTNDGWKFMTWIRDVLFSYDGKNYIVVKREHYK